MPKTEMELTAEGVKVNGELVMDGPVFLITEPPRERRLGKAESQWGMDPEDLCCVEMKPEWFEHGEAMIAKLKGWAQDYGIFEGVNWGQIVAEIQGYHAMHPRGQKFIHSMVFMGQARTYDVHVYLIWALGAEQPSVVASRMALLRSVRG